MRGLWKQGAVALLLTSCAVTLWAIPASAAISDAGITIKAKIALLTTKGISSAW